MSSDSVHFKLTHNGDTRRFAFARSHPSLLSAVQERVAAITGAAVEGVKLAWRDRDSLLYSPPSIPLDSPDDLQQAIAHIVYFNGLEEHTRSKPPCIYLEVVPPLTAAEQSQQAKAAAAAAASSALLQKLNDEVEQKKQTAAAAFAAEQMKEAEAAAMLKGEEAPALAMEKAAENEQAEAAASAAYATERLQHAKAEAAAASSDFLHKLCDEVDQNKQNEVAAHLLMLMGDQFESRETDSAKDRLKEVFENWMVAQASEAAAKEKAAEKEESKDEDDFSLDDSFGDFDSSEEAEENNGWEGADLDDLVSTDDEEKDEKEDDAASDCSTAYEPSVTAVGEEWSEMGSDKVEVAAAPTAPAVKAEQPRAAAPEAPRPALACNTCCARLELSYYVQCPSDPVHRFCLPCTKALIKRQMENQTIGCPSSNNCRIPNGNLKWWFTLGNLKSIFGEEYEEFVSKWDAKRAEVVAAEEEKEEAAAAAKIEESVTEVKVGPTMDAPEVTPVAPESEEEEEETKETDKPTEEKKSELKTDASVEAESEDTPISLEDEIKEAFATYKTQFKAAADAAEAKLAVAAAVAEKWLETEAKPVFDKAAANVDTWLQSEAKPALNKAAATVESGVQAAAAAARSGFKEVKEFFTDLFESATEEEDAKEEEKEEKKECEECTKLKERVAELEKELNQRKISESPEYMRNWLEKMNEKKESSS